MQTENLPFKKLRWFAESILYRTTINQGVKVKSTLESEEP